MWVHLSLLSECCERAEHALAVLAQGFDLSTPLERRLHIALGIALFLTMGPVQRTRAVLTKAREKADSVDDVEAQLRTLWAQWTMENIIGECCSARSTAQRFSEVARSTGDQSLILVAKVFVGAALLFDGNRAKRGIALKTFLDIMWHPRTGGIRSCFTMINALSRGRGWHVCSCRKAIWIGPRSRPG